MQYIYIYIYIHITHIELSHAIRCPQIAGSLVEADGRYNRRSGLGGHPGLLMRSLADHGMSPLVVWTTVAQPTAQLAQEAAILCQPGAAEALEDGSHNLTCRTVAVASPGAGSRSTRSCEVISGSTGGIRESQDVKGTDAL